MDERIITKISIQKRDKKRYNIFINEDYQFSVHEDVLVRHELRKGMNVSETMIVELRDEEERHRAFLDAINLLS
ncbi:MAG: recombinase RecX, partial [Bacilli bacterium]